MSNDLMPAPSLSLDDSWIYKVSVLADRVARRVSGVVHRETGLNLSQWRVLAAVADTPGRTASQVVEITPMDKGIVSRAVATLVERGLIDRHASRTDGRLSHLHLTPAGQAAYTDIVTALIADGASGTETGSAQQRGAFLTQLDAFISLYGSTG